MITFVHIPWQLWRLYLHDSLHEFHQLRHTLADMRLMVPSHHQQHWASSDFLDFAIWIGEKWLFMYFVYFSFSWTVIGLYKLYKLGKSVFYHVLQILFPISLLTSFIFLFYNGLLLFVGLNVSLFFSHLWLGFCILFTKTYSSL